MIVSEDVWKTIHSKTVDRGNVEFTGSNRIGFLSVIERIEKTKCMLIAGKILPATEFYNQ